jgi:N-acetylglutamate synthase-like GNAT family acetyltransferase
VPAIGTYYLHDLALLPQVRGLGAAGNIVNIALASATAAGFRTASLVAVNESRSFWEARGFEVLDSPTLGAKLRAYEPAARYMTRSLV